MADSVCLFGTIPREPREELVSYKMHNMCCEWIKTGYKDDCTLLFKYRVRVIDMLGEPSNWPDRKRSEKGVEWGWSQLKSSCGMDVVFDLSVLCHSSRTDTLPYIPCKGGPSEKANDTSRFPWGCCCRVCGWFWVGNDDYFLLLQNSQPVYSTDYWWTISVRMWAEVLRNRNSMLWKLAARNTTTVTEGLVCCFPGLR